MFEDGYTVIAHYRTYTDDIRILAEMGITIIQADLKDSHEILKFVAELQSSCRSFRAVIHNASSFEATSEKLTDAADQFDQFLMYI